MTLRKSAFENAGNQNFLLFPQCFQKAALSGSLKVVIVWLRVKRLLLGLFVKGMKNINFLLVQK